MPPKVEFAATVASATKELFSTGSVLPSRRVSSAAQRRRTWTATKTWSVKMRLAKTMKQRIMKVATTTTTTTTITTTTTARRMARVETCSGCGDLSPGPAPDTDKPFVIIHRSEAAGMSLVIGDKYDF